MATVMQPFRYHVFVCEQQKAEGVPCCAARGAARTIDALRREIGRQNLTAKVQITTCGSIGVCERGPNLVVYPDGLWYSGVTADDVPELVAEQFVNERPLERLLNRDESALKEEIHTNRNRYLAAMKAQDEAGVVPEPLMNTVRSFQASRILLTAFELDIFNAVGQGATAAEVARKIQADPRATEMLLNALVALEVLTKELGPFRNTPLTLRHFVDGAPHDARAGLDHSIAMWRRWSTLTDAVRAGTSVVEPPPPANGDRWLRGFIGAMQEGSKLRAKGLAAAVGVEGVRRMLDIGGGSGAYSIAFARASDSLTADILDVPAVVPITREYIEKAGLAARINVIPGDLHQPAYGGPYDLVLISSICHMLNPEDNRAMIRKSFEALAPGGRIVISDFILDPDGTGPRFAAFFAINMLVGTSAGTAYTESEYLAWLAESGFASPKRVRMPGPANLIVGERPKP
jgi:(2Fe-2S) ferredoxin/2-polyprenyl-3-methyl-5-hydroxy-6-metoxy-1,4-benzoquinol methylase